MPIPVSSALYRGTTTHTRRSTPSHKFNYPVFMAYVDLDDLESGVLDFWPIFSSRTLISLSSLLSSDHMFNEPHSIPLSTRVKDVVQRFTGKRPTGPIRLLTNLRTFGIEFNPVSFYYIFDETGEKLETLVAEVSNFPWFEQHNYVVFPADEGRSGGLRRFTGHPKAFHVSPFMGIRDYRYDWLVMSPNDSVSVKIEVSEGNRAFFMAGMDAKRVNWTLWNLCKLQILYPLHTLLVMLEILYEAGKLFMKGVTFHPHPNGVETKLSRLVHCVVSTNAWVKEKMARLLGRKQRVAVL